MELDPQPRPSAPVSRRRRPPSAASFSAGEALSTSFRIFGSQAAVLLPLAAVFLAVPLVFELLARKTQWDYFADLMVRLRRDGAEANYSWFQLMGGGNWVIHMVLSWIFPLAFQSLVAYSVFQRLRGTPARYGASFARSLGKLPIVLLSSLLLSLAILVPIIVATFIGALGGSRGMFYVMIGLAVVLALHLVTRWFVGVQAATVEKVGPAEALGRSSWLTDGAKWKVFGIVLLLYSVPYVVQYFLEKNLVQMEILVNDARAPVQTLDIWIGYGVGVVLGALAAVAAAVVYYELRKAREGIGLDQLLSVFD